MIVPIALPLAKLRRINPAIAAAVRRYRAGPSGKPDPTRQRATPYPRIYRPEAN